MEIKWHRIRAKSLIIALKYHILGDKKKKECRLALKLMKPFSFHCYYFFSRFPLVLLFTIPIFFYCCLAYMLIAPSITFIEPFWFLDWYIYPANQSNRAVSIWNYEFFSLFVTLNYLKLWTCLYGLFSSKWIDKNGELFELSMWLDGKACSNYYERNMCTKQYCSIARISCGIKGN